MQYQVGQRVEVRGRGDRCWYMATVTATTPVDDLGAYDATVQCDDGEILYRSLPADACELRPTEIVWTEADATALRVGRAVLGVFDFAYADAADVYAADVMDGTLSVRDSVHVTTLLRAIATAIRGEP